MDPITLQVMSNALRTVAEEMEAALIRAAYSPNITERRDCSTALFDAEGRMAVQSASIPVHLGAMPEAVDAVRRRNPSPGEIWLVNDPYRGGTHLPDLTLISSLYADEALIGYAVSRAHHADVGGMAPGSMPAGSRELLHEGLVIPPVRLVRDGELNQDVFEILLANSRSPEERRGDVSAQVGCQRLAQMRMTEVVERHGRETVSAAFDAVYDYAERRMRTAIAEIPDGTYSARDLMEGDGVTDEDLEIAVSVRISDDRAIVDFRGTVESAPGNCNCPIAVTRSAVYFVFRAITDPDIPASAGAFAPIEISAPEGSLVNALPPAAVAAGNVETSSRIVDVVMEAIAQAVDAPAQGQGTMNSLTLGNSDFTYYETLGGGQGASSEGPGPSAVHVAMSNTLNTPIEALETAFPLRVERYEIRRGSGGSGTHAGGDGVMRSVQVLVDCEASLITERRRTAPGGRGGGQPGGMGSARLNGRALPSKWRDHITAGTVIEIRSPGGGGWTAG